MNFAISLLLGMMPEVLYLTIFISKYKKLEKNRIKLFLLLAVGYVLLVMISQYKLIFYICYIAYSYIVLKLVTKTHIIDLFMNSIAYAFMTLLSYFCYYLFKNYWMAFSINRTILLLSPLLLGELIRKFYCYYQTLWDVKREAKIKSITVRNVSLLVINMLILVMNAVMIYLINKL